MGRNRIRRFKGRRMITVKIGVPSFTGEYFPDLTRTRADFISKQHHFERLGIRIVWETVFGIHQYCLHTARNCLLYGAATWWKDYDPPFDYFFSMDDDNGISSDGFIELIRTARRWNDEGIFSAAYSSRHAGNMTKLVAGFFDSQNAFHHQIPVDEFLSWPSEKFPIEVDTVGGGACLIPKKVIVACPPPLYQHESFPITGSARGDMVNLCEDQSLCRAVRRAGFKVFLTPVCSSHRGVIIDREKKELTTLAF